MKRIYLDSNILSCIHRPPAGNGHDKADQVLAFADRGMAEFVFSIAHLMDNRKGYHQEPQKALERLQFISKFTRNCQVTNNFDSIMTPVVKADPAQLFLQEEVELMELFGPNRKPVDLEPLIAETSAYHQLRTMPVDLEQVEGAFAQIPIRVTQTRNEPTAYNLLCDVLRFFSEMLADDFTMYKTARKETIRETAIAGRIADLEDPFPAIESLLKKHPKGRHILAAVKECLLSEPDDLEEIIGCLYLTLDYLGYAKDDLDRKQNFWNIAADAAHCYYASLCDIYVTDDRKAARKTRAIYRFLELNTVVIDYDQFLDWIGQQQGNHF